MATATAAAAAAAAAEDDHDVQLQHHSHSLPEYSTHLIASVNTTDTNKDFIRGNGNVFGLRSVFGSRALRRAHTVLTIALAVALMAVLIGTHKATTTPRTVTTTTTSAKDATTYARPVTSSGTLQDGEEDASTATATTASSSYWAPLPDSSELLHTIAFGSCMKEDMPQPFWDTLVKVAPQVTILGGDNVYMADTEECQEPQCLDLQRAYALLDAHPSFLGARRVLPMVAQPDDHDYGQNDGWSANPYKDVAKEIFLNWIQEPLDSSRRRKGEGLYTYYEWGPIGSRLQLILLDTRYSRSEFVYDETLWGYLPDTQDTGKQILSHKQWQWLEHEVLARPANVRLVFSTIQVMAEGAWGFEGWNKLPHELHRLKALLHRTCTQAESKSLPILLSGDRHNGAYYYDKNFDLYEVTASSWTHTIPHGLDPDGVPCEAEACIEPDEMRINVGESHGGGRDDSGVVWVNHFGMIKLHWTQRRVEVQLVRAETSPGYPVKMKWEANTNAGEILKSLSLDIP